LGVKGERENGKDTGKIFEMIEREVCWKTLGYMIREELQRDKLRIKAGRRAWGFEERLAEGRKVS